VPGHPYFHDERAVPWRARLADGLAAAGESGRRVLVVYGRASCAASRALVEKTIGKGEIAEYLDRHFVAVAADAEAVEPEVAALVAGLPKREPTPLCIYLDRDGRALHSTAGGRPAAVFLNDMMHATSIGARR